MIGAVCGADATLQLKSREAVVTGRYQKSVVNKNEFFDTHLYRSYSIDTRKVPIFDTHP